MAAEKGLRIKKDSPHNRRVEGALKTGKFNEGDGSSPSVRPVGGESGWVKRRRHLRGAAAHRNPHEPRTCWRRSSFRRGKCSAETTRCP
jgi:hypothetical protein